MYKKLSPIILLTIFTACGSGVEIVEQAKIFSNVNLKYCRTKAKTIFICFSNSTWNPSTYCHEQDFQYL